jgi:hypothetical protein
LKLLIKKYIVGCKTRGTKMMGGYDSTREEGEAAKGAKAKNIIIFYYNPKSLP